MLGTTQILPFVMLISLQLVDCLRSTFAEAEVVESGGSRLVTRKNNDLLEKMKEHTRTDIKIGAKIFLNHYSETCLTEAVEKLFETLNVSYLDNLILAFHPRAVESSAGGETNGEVKEGIIEWAVGNDNAVSNLRKLWSSLEKYATDKKIGQLGIADLDVDSLQDLFEGSSVHPSIAQINLAACCVVPPQLQEYCSQNDIQLLTHSDPQGMFISVLLVVP